MIINLGISLNIGAINFEHLTIPTAISLGCMKVCQNPDNVNAGCDPDDFPTQAYIDK